MAPALLQGDHHPIQRASPRPWLHGVASLGVPCASRFKEPASQKTTGVLRGSGQCPLEPTEGPRACSHCYCPLGSSYPSNSSLGRVSKKLEYGCRCLHPLRRVSSDFHHVLDALVNGQTHKWHPLHHPTYELMHEDALKGGDRDPFPHPCVLTNMTRTLPGESNPSQSQVLCISCCIFHISDPPKGQLNPTQASAPKDSWPVA